MSLKRNKSDVATSSDYATWTAAKKKIRYHAISSQKSNNWGRKSLFRVSKKRVSADIHFSACFLNTRNLRDDKFNLYIPLMCFLYFFILEIPQRYEIEIPNSISNSINVNIDVILVWWRKINSTKQQDRHYKTLNKTVVKCSYLTRRVSALFMG
jgi:hypothetical protein